MAVLDDEIKKQLKEMFQELEDKVKIIFINKINPYSDDIKELLTEISELTDKIELKIEDYSDEIKKKYEIEDAPAIIINSENLKGKIIYYGLPSGYEFGALIEAINLASKKEIEIDSKTKKFIDKLDESNKNLNLEVFVTPTCPHCPTSAYVSYKLARLSKNVKSEIYEATEFPEKSNKYNVSGVPHTVINNGEGEYIGGYPEASAVEQIMKILKL